MVAARTQFDARVKKLQTIADGLLDLIVKTQDDIDTCASRPGELLQAMCRQTKVVWDVLTAQGDKLHKAVPVYHEVDDHADATIVGDATACTQGAIKRSEWAAQLHIDQVNECVDQEIASLTTVAPSA